MVYLNRLVTILTKVASPWQYPNGCLLLDEQFGLLDLDHAFGGIGLYLSDAFDHLAREVKQWLGVGGRFSRKHSRFAFVTGFPDLRIELNATQEIHVELARGFFSPAAREDVD